MKASDVPSGPLLVDTDFVSLLMTAKAPYEAFAELVRGHVLAVSFVTVGELLAGAFAARWGQRRLDELEDRLRSYVVVPSAEAVARWWGKLSARFRDQIGVNDLWIAASALAQVDVLPLVTNNLRSFRPDRWPVSASACSS